MARNYNNPIDNIFMVAYTIRYLIMKGWLYRMAARTVEERIALIDQKIEKKKSEIETLEATKQKLLHPVNIKSVMAAAKEAGMTPEEIAEKLGLQV